MHLLQSSIRSPCKIHYLKQSSLQTYPIKSSSSSPFFPTQASTTSIRKKHSSQLPASIAARQASQGFLHAGLESLQP